MAKNLAIIPARGGSKRIPRKNIKDFLGKPIIAYSIEAALNSSLFDTVMVSTDDPEIAEVANKYGADVPFVRSFANSGDFATTLDVLKEVESDYRLKLNRVFNHICCIYPAAPLIRTEHLGLGYKKLIEADLNAVYPVVKFPYPIWRGVEIINGLTKMVWPEYANARSQDLKEIFHDAGQWYWYKPEKIFDSLFTNNTGALVLDEREVQDVDNLADWEMAEMKYRVLNA